MKKIISFSLWGNIPKYTVGAIRNAEISGMIYPGWICRFYVGKSTAKEIVDSLRTIGSEVIEMSEQGDWRGTVWRFFAAADADVDIVIFRDIDSRVSMREKSAVDDWLRSDKSFHIMRDHPCHTTKIVAGMWGVRHGKLRHIRELIDGWAMKDYWQADQDFLRECVYPLAKSDCYVHDEFFFYEEETHPFPKKRFDYEFVGEIFDENDNKTTQREEIIDLFRKERVRIGLRRATNEAFMGTVSNVRHAAEFGLNEQATAALHIETIAHQIYVLMGIFNNMFTRRYPWATPEFAVRTIDEAIINLEIRKGSAPGFMSYFIFDCIDQIDRLSSPERLKGQHFLQSAHKIAELDTRADSERITGKLDEVVRKYFEVAARIVKR
jgi:hypothetical protein